MAADPEWLAKMRSIGTISRRSGDRVQEGRDEHGRFKAVTDELNNTVTQRHQGREEVQDVHIRAPQIRLKAAQSEIRQEEVR